MSSAMNIFYVYVLYNHNDFSGSYTVNGAMILYLHISHGIAMTMYLSRWIYVPVISSPILLLTANLEEKRRFENVTTDTGTYTLVLWQQINLREQNKTTRRWTCSYSSRQARIKSSSWRYWILIRRIAMPIATI